MKKIILALLISFACTLCFAGPFGLEKGMSLAEVQTACGNREPIKIDEGKYLIVPLKQHPYFVRYVAWIDESEGLNYIKAIGSTISTNGYGLEVRSKFDSLESSLKNSYGLCSRTNFLMPGSIWDDANDWMQGLAKNERYFFSTWSNKDGSTLPESLSAIYLSVSAEDSYTGEIDLEYEFSNHEIIENKNKQIEDSVF